VIGQYANATVEQAQSAILAAKTALKKTDWKRDRRLRFRGMIKYYMGFCPTKYYWQKQSSFHNFCIGRYLSLRKEN